MASDRSSNDEILPLRVCHAGAQARNQIF